MKQIAALILIFLALLSGLAIATWLWPDPKPPSEFYIETPHAEQCYVGQVKLNTHITVRLLVLKHCRERIADAESDGVIQAANLAATEGLSITELGQHHVDKDGRLLQWGAAMTLEGLKKFIIQQMKVSAKAGDTLIIYTTGHGGSGGSVQILGDREPIARIMAQAATECDQETVWWQSSCYAAAGLPSLASFTPDEQKLFSMIASSSASRPSYWHDQTDPMKQLFLALANESPEIDPDDDGIVTASELSAFLGRAKSGADKLVFASSSNEAIFGWINYLNFIPIYSPDGRQLIAPEDFIPLP